MDLERLPLQAVATTTVATTKPASEDPLKPPPLDLDDVNGNHWSSDDSDSEEEDSEKEESKDAKSPSLLGKRKRIQPVKYSTEFSAKKQKASPQKSPGTRVQTPKQRKAKSSSLSHSVPKRARGSRCGKCEGCLRSDCGKCVYCRDKPKYGGPGKKKQRCALRTCSDFERKGYLNQSHSLNSSASAKLEDLFYAEKAKVEDLFYAEKAKDDSTKDTKKISVKGTSLKTPSKATPLKTPVKATPLKTPAKATLLKTPAKATPLKTPAKATTSSKVTPSTTSSKATPSTTSSKATPSSRATPPLLTVSSIKHATPSVAMMTSPKTPPSNALSGISSSTTPVSLISILTTKTGVTQTSVTASSKQLVNAKQALSTNQLSYAKVAQQLATTRQLISDQLKQTRSAINSSVHNNNSAAPTVSDGASAFPPIPPLISLPNGKLSPSPSITHTTTTLLNKPVTISKISTASSPRPITITKIANVTPGVESKSDPGASVSISIPPSAGSSDITSPDPEDTSERKKMVCMQCGRERVLGVARTSKFCTQRCIISWMEANPGKTPKDAVGEDPSPGKQVSPKPLPRALKNLQIDMAKPGTKLAPSESDSENEESKRQDDSLVKTNSPQISVSGNADDKRRDSIIKSLVTMISHKQKQNLVANVTVSPIPASSNSTENSTPTSQQKVTLKSSTPKISKVPAKGVVKRSTSTPNPQNLVLKKQKTQGSQKSVTFSLESAGEMGADSPLSSKLDKIASYLRPKISNETIKIKLPQGLPSDIRKWTVLQVVEYFKSTSDCYNYVDLFETQEVDGIALLLLTHETLVKCLGIKLGRAVKIMNRVMELKIYQENNN